jgi:hypothetical protein
MLHFVFTSFVRFSLQTVIIYLHSFDQLVLVMMQCGVLFQIRTEFLNVIYTSIGFKGLINSDKFAFTDYFLILSDSSVTITGRYITHAFKTIVNPLKQKLH